MQRRTLLTVLLAASLLLACSKPEPPKIKPHSARVTKVDGSGLGLALELDVENPNGFPLILQRVSGKLLVGAGVEVGTANVASAANIGAHATQRVNSEMTVAWSNMAALAPLATTGKPVPYTFQGIANVGGKSLNVDVPFKLDGELTQEQVVQAGLRGLSIPGLTTP